MAMWPMSVVPAMVGLALALLTAWVISRRADFSSTQARFVTLDGLRGYLAYGVLLHHAAIWYGYLQTGLWDQPPSALYRSLGRGGVAMFFMITAFLFGHKLLQAPDSRFDWKRLFVGRVCRLAPLYLFAVAALFVIVAILSKGSLTEGIFRLSQHALAWILFTIPGYPDLNGIHNTYLIVAGVMWTLVYEWFFYLLLPLLALWLRPRDRPAARWIVVSAVGVCAVGALLPGEKVYLLAFAIGLTAARLAGSKKFAAWAKSRAASWVVLLTLILAVWLSRWPSTTRIVLTLASLGLGFCLVASGCAFFGVLTWRVSRALGEWAYGIYLLQGLVLFTVFHFVLGGRPLRADAFWLWIMAATPVLVALSALTYRWIEVPGIALTRRWAPTGRTKPDTSLRSAAP